LEEYQEPYGHRGQTEKAKGGKYQSRTNDIAIIPTRINNAEDWTRKIQGGEAEKKGKTH
jgi:hypothetical protein